MSVTSLSPTQQHLENTVEEVKFVREIYDKPNFKIGEYQTNQWFTVLEKAQEQGKLANLPVSPLVQSLWDRYQYFFSPGVVLQKNKLELYQRVLRALQETAKSLKNCLEIAGTKQYAQYGNISNVCFESSLFAPLANRQQAAKEIERIYTKLAMGTAITRSRIEHALFNTNMRMEPPFVEVMRDGDRIVGYALCEMEYAKRAFPKPVVSSLGVDPSVFTKSQAMRHTESLLNEVFHEEMVFDGFTRVAEKSDVGLSLGETISGRF